MTPTMQTAIYALADILPSRFDKCFARSPRVAQQLWQLAVAVAQTEGARLANAIEAMSPERARELRAIDRAQGPGAEQARERVYLELEALWQIDGALMETFESRRRWAADNLRGENANLVRPYYPTAAVDSEQASERPRVARWSYDRYVEAAGMRVTPELAKGVGSAASSRKAAWKSQRLNAVGLDVIPATLRLWLECVERVRATCEAAGPHGHMASLANALADVPFVIGRTEDPVTDRNDFMERVLAGRDPDVLERVRQYLCEVAPEIRIAAWRVVDGALDLYRAVSAQAVFEDWVFPDDGDVKECSGWESTIAPGGVEMSRIVYTCDSRSTLDDDASAKVSFLVVFDDALRIVDVSALDMRTGNEFGHTGASTRPCAPVL